MNDPGKSMSRSDTWAWPLVVLAALAAGCSRAGGAPEQERALPPAGQDAAVAQTGDLSADDAPAKGIAGRLERLRATGRFEEFIDAAIVAAEDHPELAAVQIQTSEALLASGRPADAEEPALRAAARARDDGDVEMAGQALKLWATARMRQNEPLDEARAGHVLAQLPPSDANVRLLDFWRGALGGRAAYRASAASPDSAQLKPADVAGGTIPFELNAVEVRANGTRMPIVFIDTGAQYTLLTAEAARAAGIETGAGGTQLVGFAGLVARPGLIERLELGELVVEDVPVLVGDSQPLLALGGQMSLGTELMHHVRFRIDYPARRVVVERADRPLPRELPPPLWTIPVWTFSPICLARGQLAGGAMARVLVDTGDRAGTFVSYRWGRRHMPQLGGSGSGLVFRFKKRNLTLDALDLGSQTLADWPVVNTIPQELDRLNQVDLILGHDLLWPYELSIDLPRRVLELRGGTSPEAETK